MSVVLTARRELRQVGDPRFLSARIYLAIFRSLDPAKQSELRIENELEKKSAPRRMIFQVVVVIRGERAQPWQVVPGDGREIMMLVVITHVQADAIDRPVVTISLLIRIVCIMFLNPACTDRMQADRKCKGTTKIEQAGPSAEVHDGRVVSDGAKEVEKNPAVPHR